MNNLAKKFLTAAEQQQVTDTVKKAELKTSGEIVPMIVSRSHDYPRATLTASLFFSLPVTFLTTQLLSHLFWVNPENIYFFFTLFIPIFIISHLLAGKYPAMTRLFISADELNREVEEEAIKSFFQERLYETKENNGILIFISVFEKKAWILADHGIDQKIAPHIWNEVITDLTRNIRDNNRCLGLCQAVSRVGDILTSHFPHQKDDTDELHNLIIR